MVGGRSVGTFDIMLSHDGSDLVLRLRSKTGLANRILPHSDTSKTLHILCTLMIISRIGIRLSLVHVHINQRDGSAVDESSHYNLLSLISIYFTFKK